jgi:broad specificity phosphatase PhoE
MVGLPARGKSYTANKITTYLSWLGIKTKVFTTNVDQKRQVQNRPRVDGNYAGSNHVVGYVGVNSGSGGNAVTPERRNGNHSSSLSVGGGGVNNDGNHGVRNNAGNYVIGSRVVSAGSLGYVGTAGGHSVVSTGSHGSVGSAGGRGVVSTGSHGSVGGAGSHGVVSTGNHGSVSGTNHVRDQMMIATEVLGKIKAWLDAGGEVAIFDATNTTREQRTQIIDTCNNFEPEIPVIFIENICDDPQIIAENFKQKLCTAPEYKGMSIYDATIDLKTRIYQYERAYKTIDDDSLSYIKIFNLQSMVICNRISGSVPQLLASYLTSLHTQTPRVIFFSRPAECEENQENDKFQLTTKFTERGERYAKRLADSILIRIPKRLQSALVVYTGTSESCIQTAKYITSKSSFTQTTSLNKMHTGDCRGMSTKILKEKKPDIYEAWEKDRLNYRFPGGESFADLIQRLRGLVLELEQLTVPVLVISHQAPIEALYCYFKGKSPHFAPYLQVPSHTVIELVSTSGGVWTEKHYAL